MEIKVFVEIPALDHLAEALNGKTANCKEVQIHTEMNTTSAAAPVSVREPAVAMPTSEHVAVTQAPVQGAAGIGGEDLMPPITHAKLGASSAARWLACPPSADLCERFPDKGSSFAAEGTLAHELAELKVRKHFTPMFKTAYTRAYNKIKKDELYTPEMDHVTDDYLEYIKDCAMQYDAAPSVICEVQVDFSAYVPGGYGTADCIMLGGGTMRVIDFKYGKGVPVSTEENPQMMLYAIGALAQYSLLYRIDKVILTSGRGGMCSPEPSWRGRARGILPPAPTAGSVRPARSVKCWQSRT